jgi:hypothetical protein
MMKWTLAMLKINVIQNGSAIDLHVSQQARVFSFCYPRITSYSPRAWCNRILYRYETLERNKVDSQQRQGYRNGESGCFRTSNSGSAWEIAILVSVRLREANVYSTIHSSSTIDKLYGLYCKASSFDPLQTEWDPIGCQSINVKWTPENFTLCSVSRLATLLDFWWVLILFINRS